MQDLRAEDKAVLDAFAKRQQREGIALRSTGTRLLTYGPGEEIARWTADKIEAVWSGGFVGELALRNLRGMLPDNTFVAIGGEGEPETSPASGRPEQPENPEPSAPDTAGPQEHIMREIDRITREMVRSTQPRRGVLDAGVIAEAKHGKAIRRAGLEDASLYHDLDHGRAIQEARSLSYHVQGSAIYVFQFSQDGSKIYFYPTEQLKNGGWKGVAVKWYQDKRGPDKAISTTVTKIDAQRYGHLPKVDVPVEVLRKFEAHDRFSSLTEAKQPRLGTGGRFAEVVDKATQFYKAKGYSDEEAAELAAKTAAMIGQKKYGTKRMARWAVAERGTPGPATRRRTRKG